MASPEFSVATMKYRTNVESPSEADVLRNLEREILDAVASEECPSGWPRYDPSTYDGQLEVKASLVRKAFPEAVSGVEVFGSPPAHHRMRAKLGIVIGGGGGGGAAVSGGLEGSENGEECDDDVSYYSNCSEGKIDVLEIACEGICAAMPLLLKALKSEPELRRGATMVTFLSKRNGTFVNATSSIGELLPSECVACMVYDRPLDDEKWKEAAKRTQAKWATLGSGGDVDSGGGGRRRRTENGSGGTGVEEEEEVVGEEEGRVVQMTLIGQAKGHRVVVGPLKCAADGEVQEKDYVHEEYALRDGRVLRYKHVLGHFSNPNAYACTHTLDWLSDVVNSCVVPHLSLQQHAAGDGGNGALDLLELYCGNGNHTVALAPLFRAALAVEINPTLCRAAEDNLAANGVTNAAIQHSPSHAFCTRVLRKQSWIHKPSGREFEFGAVLVDPPRAGLDSLTLALVAKYAHVLYISCNPFVSLRRDLDLLQAPPHNFTVQRLALIDHFPYTPHTECAVYLRRGAP